LTARPEPDIHDIIGTPPPSSVSKLFMHDIPDHSTKDDISRYAIHMLQGPPLIATPEELEKLSEKAQLSFQWVATACRYITNRDDGNQGVLPLVRLRKVLSSSGSADSQSSLYSLYSTVLDAQFGTSATEDLELPKLLLGVLVVATKPLKLPVMLQLLDSHLSKYGEKTEVKKAAAIILGHLSSLITGTQTEDTLFPIHASFLDFLQDSANNPKYCVDTLKTHQLLAKGCFDVMQHGEKRLTFNICKLSNSFLPNSSIPELPAQIEKNIGSALAYACHSWTSHLAVASDVSPEMLKAIETLLSTNQFLYWLEVMSLTGASP
ncbi:hypothetical protein DL93DRAFT_2035790, partial [Clavulina sp. PMI_390]